jgi:uncharacterized protein (DUF2267 family)
MLYHSFVEQIQNFDFIPDEHTADSALKAALGIIMSVMDDAHAMRLAQELPDPLDYETLRGNQVGPIELSFDEAVTSLAVQLDLSAGQAWELMKRAIHCIKTSVDLDLVIAAFSSLPQDWKEMMTDA